MSAISVGVAPSGECLRSKGRYGSCGWQLKLCDPLAIGPYLSALEMRFMTKRYTDQCTLLQMTYVYYENYTQSTHNIYCGLLMSARSNEIASEPFVKISTPVST